MIKHIFYVDDLQIYLHTTKDMILESIARLFETAKLVSGWAEGAGLRLNISKTEAILFDSKKGDIVNVMSLPGVEMQSGVLIPFSSEVVSLGVTLDCKLSWKPHINQVAEKVNKALYSLRFIRASTSETLRKRLVEALVQPHLDYCAVVYIDITNEQLIRRQRLHNSCVRYIFGVRKDALITPYRKRLGCHKLRCRCRVISSSRSDSLELSPSPLYATFHHIVNSGGQ